LRVGLAGDFNGFSNSRLAILDNNGLGALYRLFDGKDVFALLTAKVVVGARAGVLISINFVFTFAGL